MEMDGIEIFERNLISFYSVHVLNYVVGCGEWL